MINEEELKSEQKYLDGVIDTLEQQLSFLNNSIYDQEKNLQETSQYMASSFYDMDAEEQAVAKQMMEQLQLGIVALNDTRSLKERQKQSAYFGRVDFKADDENEVNAYYIGVAHIGTNEKPMPLVLDWRAPLSSIYYDYELGRAEYQAPYQKIEGRIYLKRQYKTQERNLVYAFDSSLTIGDEILKAELGKNASSKMKNIVATIQAHQNKIIRAEIGKNMIVQGVAGSGKTSVALHRVAYLLYTNKIKASDILIVSPSSLFSDYISNVLPELGESNTPKITFEEIAQKELEGFVGFEPKSQMFENIASGNNPKRLLDVQTKNTFDFYEKLKNYLETSVAVKFKASDIKLGKNKILAEDIQKLYYENYQTKTPAVRVEWIADYVLDRLEMGGKNQQALFDRVKKVLFTMFENTNILEIYKTFLQTQNMEFSSVQIGKESFVGFEDVPAVLYIKNYLIGVEKEKHFKHIIIDEMQDYSPLAMDIIQTIYPNTKTVLGDTSQTLEKTLDKNYLKKLGKLLDDAEIYNLNTTYRSTLEIAKYSQKIIKLSGVKNFNRAGEKVLSISGGYKALNQTLVDLCKEYESVAVITPTQKEAFIAGKKISEKLGFFVVDESCGQTNQKFVVMPVAMSKGLEFDAVVYLENNVPEKLAKNIKYVACTRALHRLVVVEM